MHFLQPLNFVSDIHLGGICGAVLINFSRRQRELFVNQKPCKIVPCDLPIVAVTHHHPIAMTDCHKEVGHLSPSAFFLLFVVMASSSLKWHRIQFELKLVDVVGYLEEMIDLVEGSNDSCVGFGSSYD